MTFEQRMAELGVDLSDLPEHERIPILGINRTIFEWKGELLDGEVDLYRYILHLIDVIDRMETRLVNVTGELEWLKKMDHDLKGCCTCLHWGTDDPECDDCEPFEDSQYVYFGVPEDWSVDG